VFLKSLEKCCTFLDVLANLTQDILEERVLLLFGKDIKTLYERQTGVDHNRELACEYRKFFCTNLFTAANFRYRDDVALFRRLRHSDLVTTKQRAKFILAGGFAFAGNYFVKAVPTFEGVCWHCVY
jgi:hypothetical protein